MNYNLYSLAKPETFWFNASWSFQHKLLKLKDCMDEQKIGKFQCMVCHNNNGDEEMCWSKSSQSSSSEWN